MRALAFVLALWAVGATAAPETSLRPLARPEAAPVNVALKRPVSRPGTNARTPDVAQAPARTPQLAPMAVAQAVPSFTTLRPLLRPRTVEQKAMARRNERRKGQVCGDPDLQGEVVGYVPGRIAACGIDEAVRIRSVSGVTLSQQALMNCRTAQALKTWTEKAAKPALQGKGGGLASFRVAAHYACRTRNNRPGARISEHGKGNAIDISGFTLRNGTQLTVLRDWNSSNAKALREMHRKACGPFGTVLGPRADRFHQDHFHFDTARHRGGPFCR